MSEPTTLAPARWMKARGSGVPTVAPPAAAPTKTRDTMSQATGAGREGESPSMRPEMTKRMPWNHRNLRRPYLSAI